MRPRSAGALGRRWRARSTRRADRRVAPTELLDIDRECHELIWAAADNRFLTDTLDMLYAQSDRLWHMYLADVADMLPRRRRAPSRSSTPCATATAIVRPSWPRPTSARSTQQIRAAVTRRLGPPLAGA